MTLLDNKFCKGTPRDRVFVATPIPKYPKHTERTPTYYTSN